MGVCDLVRCGPITLVQSVYDLVHGRYFTTWPRFGTGYLRFGPIYSDLVRTNNKNLHQIGVTNYLSSTVNTDLDLEMTIIILHRHCLAVNCTVAQHVS